MVSIPPGAVAILPTVIVTALGGIDTAEDLEAARLRAAAAKRGD